MATGMHMSSKMSYGCHCQDPEVATAQVLSSWLHQHQQAWSPISKFLLCYFLSFVQVTPEEKWWKWELDQYKAFEIASQEPAVIRLYPQTLRLTKANYHAMALEQCSHVSWKMGWTACGHYEKRFHQYFHGRPFTILSDYQETAGIPAMASARIQRWALTLLVVSYSLEW
jgi:hypothetical protein